MNISMRLAITAMLAALLGASLQAMAADWPQYRADSGRSGYSPEQLPDALHLEWAFQAPHAPQPAWPDVHWQRQTYDLAYQPVVAGGMLYYGSSVDCQVHALDARTGQRRWSFFTDGPVRFAPAVWEDRVFAVSDDGYLYCLSARDGSLLWKVNGGLRDERILGNGRMVSRWAARGGPVVHDGVVYFGAGLFAAHGFFLHAIDARTGRPVYVNGTSGSLRRNHITGGASFANVAAQGYLAVCGDALVVPTGRAVPAVFERADGEFRYFHALELSYTGGSWVMAVDNLLFNADLILDLKTGYTLSSKVANAQEHMGIRGRPAEAEVMIEAAASPTNLYVATARRVKALDRSSPFVKDSDVFNMTTQLFFKVRGDGAKAATSHRFMATADLWATPVDGSGTIIVAGTTVYAGGKGVVTALAGPTGKVLWSQKIDGTACGLAVADGRLYASTDTGRIYCFGPQAPVEPAVVRPAAATTASADDYDRLARQIIERTGVRDGYALDIGCGDGRLSEALARQTNLHILAVESDQRQVAAARERLDRAGLYGHRVTVLRADLGETGLPEYFADLVVSGRSASQGAQAVPQAEWNRLLRPFGGVAALGGAGELALTQRGALEGAGDWTHQFASPANTSCSGDKLLRGPLGILWFGVGGPAGMHGEKSRSPAPLFVEGRLYYQTSGSLQCMNAYNGRIMWEVPIKKFKWTRTYNGSEVVGSNYCVTPDSVYISEYDRCRRLDGRTGEELGSFATPKLDTGKPPVWMQVFVKDDLLLGTLESPRQEKGYPREGTPRIGTSMMLQGLTSSEEATHLFAMDRLSGQMRWVYPARTLIIPNSIAIANGRVYLIDRPIHKGGQAPPGAPKASLVVLDAATGRTLWTLEENVIGSMLAVSEEYDLLLMGSDVKERGTLFSDYPEVLAVFNADSGEKLWDKQVLYKQRPMIIGRTIIAEGYDFDDSKRGSATTTHYPSAWDLLTGQEKMRANPVTGRQEAWVYGRSTKCSYVTSSENLVFFRNGMLTYFDLERDEGQANALAVRPSCFINVLPVGGVIVAPNIFAGCQCNVLMRTSLALHSYPQQEHWTVFNGREPEPGVLRHLFLNFGALGDRRDADGNLWFAMPRPTGEFRSNRSDMKTVTLAGLVTMNGLKPFFNGDYDMAEDLEAQTGIVSRHHNVEMVQVEGTSTSWVGASGCSGPLELQIHVGRMPADAEYTVRLHFAEVEDILPGQRVFDVVLAGQTVLSGFDPVAQAGGTRRAVVREFRAKAQAGKLELKLLPRQGQPSLSGLEVLVQP